MDLHDFKDVAENYDRYLSVMYQDNDNHDGFREFYLDLARKYGAGGVVDIACGTGAVLLYLAERGIDVDGTDLSEEMCLVARKKAEQLGLQLRIVPADMTKFHTDRKYSLAIIARSGFMHLPSSRLQRDALLNIRDQLTEGGILTFNTFDPNPALQAEMMKTGPEDYSFRLEYVNSQGQREKIYNAMTYDPCSQLMHGNWKFETLDEAGEVIGERVRPLLMRQTYRSEVFLLAELCGFQVLDIYRGYLGDKENLSAPNDGVNHTGNLIWIMQKK
jgi:ubiquinone/menaquinone biosynthesis C-methylase UbiE